MWVHARSMTSKMTFSLSHRLRLLLLGLSLLLKATSPGHAQSGALDKSFSPTTGPDSLVYAVATQPDGKIVIGGQFTSVNSTNRPRVARLNANGSLDLGFGTTAGVNDTIYALAIQPDGRVLIG